jgi:hypothetical protein
VRQAHEIRNKIDKVREADQASAQPGILTRWLTRRIVHHLGVQCGISGHWK